ncbi:MAG: hypothetical protein ACR2IE_18020, partial [Candidatus Sumerlaeaceae bacterium]
PGVKRSTSHLPRHTVESLYARLSSHMKNVPEIKGFILLNITMISFEIGLVYLSSQGEQSMRVQPCKQL